MRDGTRVLGELGHNLLVVLRRQDVHSGVIGADSQVFPVRRILHFVQHLRELVLRLVHNLHLPLNIQYDQFAIAQTTRQLLGIDAEGTGANGGRQLPALEDPFLLQVP